MSMRQSLVRSAALNLQMYLYENYKVWPDIFELQEHIDNNIGFVCSALEEQAEWYENNVIGDDHA